MLKEGFIWMSHPETGGVTTAHENAFEEVWKDLGWELCDAPPEADPDAMIAEVSEPVVDSQEVAEEELSRKPPKNRPSPSPER